MKSDLTISITGQLVMVLENIHTGEKTTYTGKNIVTDAGDLFYAQRCALLTVGSPIGPVPTNFTDTNGVPDMLMELYSGASGAPDKANDRSDLATLVTGSDQVIDATYPKVNDDDVNNTGAGVDIVTYRVTYATGDANNASIADVILTNPDQGASEPILMHAEFTPFAKTTSFILKVFLNHQLNGV